MGDEVKVDRCHDQISAGRIIRVKVGWDELVGQGRARPQLVLVWHDVSKRGRGRARLQASSPMATYHQHTRSAHILLASVGACNIRSVDR